MSTSTQHIALAAVGPDEKTPRARVHDLHVTFERRGVPLHALRGVSMDVQPGEVLALVGESGSGKSVMGLALLGLSLAGTLFVLFRQMDAKASAERKAQVRTVDRSERVRTYNFPENRISDHRVGYKAYNLDQVIDGDLDGVINALAAADLEAKLAAE